MGEKLHKNFGIVPGIKRSFYIKQDNSVSRLSVNQHDLSKIKHDILMYWFNVSIVSENAKPPTFPVEKLVRP